MRLSFIESQRGKGRWLNGHALEMMNLNVFLPILCLCGLSVALLYSAAAGIGPWAWKQALYDSLFLFVAIAIACLNTNKLYRYAYLGYVASIVMLLGVLAFGKVIMGARRWIDLGLFNLQPSEFAKVGLVLGLARLFHTISVYKKILDVKLLAPVAMIMVPFGLVALQPDLATAMTMLLMGGAICFLCGVRIEFFLGIFGLVLVIMPVIWSMLHDYQKLRVLNFLNPDRDPLGSGYSVIQSKIAIGSGGFFGKGFMKGNQSHLNFLPEHQTDFIFTMLAEELGFLGCLLVIFCYMYIIGYGMRVAVRANSVFCKTIASGSSFILFMHCAINAGMVMGLLPVAGVPMPLLSYGGSSVATSMIAVGLILHADANRSKELY